MSSSVQTAAHHSSNHHQFHHSLHTSQYHQELTSKMTPRPNSEDQLVNIHPLRQLPIATSRQVSRDSDVSVDHHRDDAIQETNKALKEISSVPQATASVVSPRENTDSTTQAFSLIGSSNDSSTSSSSTKIPILEAAMPNDVVRQEASTTSTILSSTLPPSQKTATATSNQTSTAPHYTISPPAIGMQSSNDRSPSAGNKRKMGSPSSQCSTPMSRRDSLPMGLRNKKMKATDCLLFAATLLEQETAETLVAARNAPPTTTTSPQPTTAVSTALGPSTIQSPPIKRTKPLKKMVCEKLERSLQEAAKQKKEQEELDQKLRQEHQQDTTSSTSSQQDQDCENKPNDADVLCGRGGKVNKHPGNIVYRKVVEYNKSYYQSVHKKHRILVSQSIVKAILNYGGRFMGQKGKEWTPICFKRAVQKTSQALRERSNSSDTLGPDFTAAAAAASAASKIVVEAAVPNN